MHIRLPRWVKDYIFTPNQALPLSAQDRTSLQKIEAPVVHWGFREES